MSCLIDRVLEKAGMKSHTTFMLRTFFVYTLALNMPIFKKKKSSQRYLGKIVPIFKHHRFWILTFGLLKNIKSSKKRRSCERRWKWRDFFGLYLLSGGRRTFYPLAVFAGPNLRVIGTKKEYWACFLSSFE